MAAAGINSAGEDIKVYRVAAITSPSPTTLAAAAISANEVKDLTAFTFPATTRGVREKNILGSDVTQPLSAKVTYGEASGTVVFDPSDTIHKALRDDTGTTNFSYIVVYTTASGEVTYAEFKGFVTAATAATADDALNTIDFTIQSTSRIIWADAP